LLTFDLRCAAGLRLRLLLRAGGDKLLFVTKFPVVGATVAATAAFPVENLRVTGGDLTEAKKISTLIKFIARSFFEMENCRLYSNCTICSASIRIGEQLRYKSNNNCKHAVCTFKFEYRVNISSLSARAT
jgi:hypothetical protein